MKKRIFSLIGVILFVALLWYLFIKPADYIVSFKTKAIPGTINQTIKLWGSDLGNSKLIEQQDITHFTHQLIFKDSIHSYTWKIKSVNDSISEVRVYITDEQNSFKNRIEIPFSETMFEKRSKKTITDLITVLKEHEKRIKITIDGEAEVPSKFVAYVPMKSFQNQKAYYMMREYPFLNGVLVKNKIELDGHPLIEIVDWNMANDSIVFNFCYPIKYNDSLPEIKGLKYKQLKAQKAIKAIYNGNYITSDRAWYSLINYAKKKSITINKKPIEVFYNNPNMGGNELDWKAEIFMPIQ